MTHKKSVKFQSELNLIKAPRNVVNKTGYYYNWDSDNYFPYKLINLYNRVPQHAGLLNTEIQLGQGTELIIEGNVVEYETFYKTYADVPLSEVVNDIISDYFFYNGFSLKINYNQNKSLGYLSSLPFCGVRVGTNADKYDRPTHYYYSRDWRNYRLKENRIKSYGSYKAIFPDKEKEECLIYNYSNFGVDKSSYYPTPSYFSAIDSIILFEQLSNYNISSVLNGFHPSMFLSVNDTDKQNISDDDYAELCAMFTGDNGTAAAGKTYVTRNIEVKSVQINNQLTDNVFDNLKNSIQTAINQAHSITSPVVASLAGGGSLASNADEIKVAFQTFYNKEIKPKQKIVLNEINNLLKELGWSFSVSIKEINLLEGIEDTLKQPNTSTNPVGETLSEEDSNTSNVNSTLTNLKGRQMQGMLRIVNKYKKQILTRSQAVLLLRSSFGFTDEEIDTLLDDNYDE
jgi:hypothetical protein